MTNRAYDAVVIGASAGAVESLGMILPLLPADFPVPIVIVVHLPPDKESVMADLFHARCKIAVKEAEDKEPMNPATVYLGAPDYHLLIEKNGSLSFSNEEAVLYSRPSIDVMFETAADAFGERVIGIVLSGANHDGATGLASIAAAGGLAIVQDPATAYAAEMPQAALKKCAQAQVLPLEQIAGFLQKVILS